MPLAFATAVCPASFIHEGRTVVLEVVLPPFTVAVVPVAPVEPFDAVVPPPVELATAAGPPVTVGPMFLTPFTIWFGL
jgi:hypothetical protein